MNARKRRDPGLTRRQTRGHPGPHHAVQRGPWPPGSALRYRALLAFVAREGHAHVPHGHVEDGLRLEAWVRRQRVAYWKGLLTPEQVSILERLPGWLWRAGRPFHEHSRARMMRLLRAYAAREGHARVPQKHREKGIPLGAWVVRQRRAYHEGRLTKADVRALTAIPGWSWTARPLERRPHAVMLRALEQFAQRQGHARVPTSHVEGDAPLGNWVQRQRAEYHKGRLSDAQTRILERLPGWSWKVRAPVPPLDRYLKALGEFVRREGHARVPVAHVEGKLRLGTWVRGRRRDLDRGRLDPALTRHLEKLPGWCWDAPDADFEKMLEVLRRYAKREGHAYVPVNHRETGGIQLGRWVSRQRLLYRRGTLAPERVEALEALIGWTWAAKARWPPRRMLRTLHEFIRREGHARVPWGHVEDGIALGSWVAWCRRTHKKGKLSPDTVAALEAIPEWLWSSSRPPEQMLTALRAFVRREGHSRVPGSHREGGLPLGSWVHTRRRAYHEGRSSPQMTSLLENMDHWSWFPLMDHRGEMLELLLRYVARHGHARVPLSHVQDGKKLGAWVEDRRRAYWTGLLSDAQTRSLESLRGWSWTSEPPRGKKKPAASGSRSR